MITEHLDPLVEALEKSAQEIEDVLIGSTTGEQCKAPGPGKWSARDVICHLVDTERLILRPRMEALLREPEPWFPDIDHLPWVEAHRYSEQEPAAKLREFLEERRQTVELVRAAGAEQRQARGTHEIRGPISFSDVVEFCASHTRTHADQIRRALAAARQ